MAEQQDVEEVQARELRDRLPDMLDRASMRGERFRITRHGRPVALLIGLDPETGEQVPPHVAVAPAVDAAVVAP